MHASNGGATKRMNQKLMELRERDRATNLKISTLLSK